MSGEFRLLRGDRLGWYCAAADPIAYSTDAVADREVYVNERREEIAFPNRVPGGYRHSIAVTVDVGSPGLSSLLIAKGGAGRVDSTRMHSTRPAFTWTRSMLSVLLCAVHLARHGTAHVSRRGAARRMDSDPLFCGT